MSIRIPEDAARGRLLEALGLARSEAKLPQAWLDFSRQVFGMPAKTYTTALGTALLAKATNDSVDPLAIKATGDRGYSMRTLGHGVLVPAARANAFSLRATGREPLNNQPFFRYEHLTAVDRVLNRAQLDWYVRELGKADALGADEALLALAAFLRVATEEAAKRTDVQLQAGEISAQALLRAVSAFVAPEVEDRPRRLQAVGAAAMALGHADVRSRKINDPSRDVPGDVQAYDEGTPYASMEVRGKAVPATELAAFIDSCVAHEVRRVILFVDAPAHRPLVVPTVDSQVMRDEVVLVSVYESATALVAEAITWADLPLGSATAAFSQQLLERLREIEANQAALEGWAALVAGEGGAGSEAS